MGSLVWLFCSIIANLGGCSVAVVFFGGRCGFASLGPVLGDTPTLHPLLLLPPGKHPGRSGMGWSSRPTTSAKHTVLAVASRLHVVNARSSNPLCWFGNV